MDDAYRLRAALAALEAVPPRRLRALADWLDVRDRRDLAARMGVTEAEVPDYMVRAKGTVQRDLRRMAGLSETALEEVA